MRQNAALNIYYFFSKLQNINNKNYTISMKLKNEHINVFRNLISIYKIDCL